MNFMELVKPELFIMVPFLYGIGYVMSRVPKVKDWMINIMITIISLGVVMLYMFAFMPDGKAMQTAVSAIIQSVIIAMATIISEHTIEKLIVNKTENITAKQIEDTPKTDIKSLSDEVKKIEHLITSIEDSNKVSIDKDSNNN